MEVCQPNTDNGNLKIIETPPNVHIECNPYLNALTATNLKWNGNYRVEVIINHNKRDLPPRNQSSK